MSRNLKPHQVDALKTIRGRLVYELNMDTYTIHVGPETSENDALDAIEKHMAHVRAIHAIDTAIDVEPNINEYQCLRRCAVGAIQRLPESDTERMLRDEDVLDTANILGTWRR